MYDNTIATLLWFMSLSLLRRVQGAGGSKLAEIVIPYDVRGIDVLVKFHQFKYIHAKKLKAEKCLKN